MRALSRRYSAEEAIADSNPPPKPSVKLERTLEAVQKALAGAVEIVAAISDARDPYTAGHERRVAALACAIGTELGLPKDQIDGIRVMGYVHDLGKIGIPTEILIKPAKLSQHELGIVREHAETGYNIMKKLDFPWPVADVVRQHHEWVDGSGYPLGIDGTQILLEAKVLTVSDVVEALASHRPYRAGLGLEQGVHEVVAHRGTRYDERVVDACVQVVKDGRFSLG